MSHFLFDFFYPHWNPHLFTEIKTNGHLSLQTLKIIIIDATLALLATLFFAFQETSMTQTMIMVAGATLAILPDFSEIPFYFFQNQNSFLKKIITFEHLYQARANWFWGTLSQLVVIALCLWQLLK